MYRPHPKVGDYRSYNLGVTAVGVILIMAGLPMVILSCGFFFEPEALFVSVNMSDTSIGIAFNNLGLAWAGGAISGAIIAYRTKNYIYTLLGPFAGYVSGAPAFDVYAPWQMFLVALVAPLVVLRRVRVDAAQGDRRAQAHQPVPGRRLVRHPHGRPDRVGQKGGYFGVEEGTYAFQNSEINVGWQALGLVVCIAVGLVTAWVLAAILERTTGLREDEDTIVEGFDLRKWEIIHDIEPQHPAGADGEAPRVVATTRGNGAETAGSGVERSDA